MEYFCTGLFLEIKLKVGSSIKKPYIPNYLPPSIIDDLETFCIYLSAHTSVHLMGKFIIYVNIVFYEMLVQYWTKKLWDIHGRITNLKLTSFTFICLKMLEILRNLFHCFTLLSIPFNKYSERCRVLFSINLIYNAWCNQIHPLSRLITDPT